MRRLVAIAASLAGLAALGQAASGIALIDDDGRGLSCSFRRTSSTCAPVAAASYYSFASDISSVTTLQAAVASGDKVGNWFGFGPSADWGGSNEAFTAIGSPVAQTHKTCPNGPTCAAVSSQWLDNGVGYKSATATRTYAGDFSLCWLGILRGDDNAIADIWKGSGNNLTYALTVSSGSLIWYVGNGTTFTAATASPNFTARARHFICGTYHYISSGSSVTTLYLDGVSVATSSSAVGPLYAQSAVIGINAMGTGSASGQYQAFEELFGTETALSSSRVLALAHSVLADSNGSWTTSRTTASSCPADADETAFTVIPAGRPCISSIGVGSFPASTNRLLHSDLLSDAAWSDLTNAGKVSGAVSGASHPDGTVGTPGSISDDTNSFEGRCQSVTISTQTTYTASAFFKAYQTSPTKARITITGTGNSAGNTTCDFADLSNSEWRRRGCTSAAFGSGLTAVSVCFAYGNAATDQGVMWITSTQLETGSVMTPYKRTEGSTFAGAADTGYRLSTPPAIVSAARTTGSALQCLTPGFSGAVPAAIRSVMLGGGGTRIAYANSGRGLCSYDGTSDTCVAPNMDFQRQVPFCTRVSWTSGGSLAVSDFHRANDNSNATTGLGAISKLNLGIDDDNSSYPASGYVGSVYFSASASGMQQGAKWAAIGDSITRGYDTTPYYVEGYPRYLQGLWGVSPTGKYIDNYAVGGAETSDIATQFSASVSRKCPAYVGLIVMGGYNDVKNGTGTAAQIFARKQAIYDAALAQGMRLVIVSTPPALALIGATPEAKSHALNSLDSTYCTAHSSSCTFVDFHTIMDDGTDNESSADTVDSIHLSQVGTLKFAKALYSGVSW
jgi:lysophospholipase L1-like esterase